MGKHTQIDEPKNEKIKHKKKKNIKKRRRIILLTIVIILGIFVGVRIYRAGGNLLAALLGHDKNTRFNLEKLQFLILGESTGMSDTIIVAQYNPATQEGALLSIPRDTFIGTSKSSAYASDKINSLYSHGSTPEKTLKAVNEITGLNIRYYILVDTEALIKLVDLIGGLDFNVPIDMDYDDPTQNLHIHLKAGYQRLSGAQVEQLVRFRHNNNCTTYSYSEYGGEDHGRMRTQRNAIIEIAKQTIKFKNVKEIFNIIDILKEYVDTNMDLDSIKDYVPYVSDMDMNGIKTAQIPGIDDVANGIWFFFHDEEETYALVNELFYGITPEEEKESSEETNSSDE